MDLRTKKVIRKNYPTDILDAHNFNSEIKHQVTEYPNYESLLSKFIEIEENSDVVLRKTNGLLEFQETNFHLHEDTMSHILDSNLNTKIEIQRFNSDILKALEQCDDPNKLKLVTLLNQIKNYLETSQPRGCKWKRVSLKPCTNSPIQSGFIKKGTEIGEHYCLLSWSGNTEQHKQYYLLVSLSIDTDQARTFLIPLNIQCQQGKLQFTINGKIINFGLRKNIEENLTNSPSVSILSENSFIVNSTLCKISDKGIVHKIHNFEVKQDGSSELQDSRKVFGTFTGSDQTGQVSQVSVFGFEYNDSDNKSVTNTKIIGLFKF